MARRLGNVVTRERCRDSTWLKERNETSLPRAAKWWLLPRDACVPREMRSGQRFLQLKQQKCNSQHPDTSSGQTDFAICWYCKKWSIGTTFWRATSAFLRILELGFGFFFFSQSLCSILSNSWFRNTLSILVKCENQRGFFCWFFEVSFVFQALENTVVLSGEYNTILCWCLVPLYMSLKKSLVMLMVCGNR